MKQWFWRDGRFSWPVFFILVYPSVNLLLIDFLWRAVNASIETLLTFVVLGNLVVVGALAFFAFRRKRATG